MHMLLIILSLLLVGCVWDSNSGSRDFLPLDDSEYPYSGIYRLVIETEGMGDLRDTETSLDAKIQVYGAKEPVSMVLDGKLRGRGNASFSGMPKYSMKLTLDSKYPMLGMAADQEWDLISNSSDKTMMRNAVAFLLSSNLGMPYTPESRFAEVYLNRRYLGVYLMVEHVKVSKNRINLPQTGASFLMEKTTRPKSDEVYVTSAWNHIFKIKYPKNPSALKLDSLKKMIDEFESYLKAGKYDSIEGRIDLDAFFKFYWIQELSKNFDGNFVRSIFFYGSDNRPWEMGPVWDFDAAFGNWEKDYLISTSGWYIRGGDWYRQILSDKEMLRMANASWNDNRHLIAAVVDSIDVMKKNLARPAKNEFKRWPILENTENAIYVEKYKSYSEAVDSLRAWFVRRMLWIDEQTKQ